MRARDFVANIHKNKRLTESAHKELCLQIARLENTFNKHIELGKEYIPVPIYIIQDEMDVFGRNSHRGEFCKLTKINIETFEFENKLGKVIEWPNHKQVGVSYMTTLIAHDVEMYNKIRTMLALIFNLDLPPSSEEE